MPKGYKLAKLYDSPEPTYYEKPSADVDSTSLLETQSKVEAKGVFSHIILYYYTFSLVGVSCFCSSSTFCSCCHFVKPTLFTLIFALLGPNALMAGGRRKGGPGGCYRVCPQPVVHRNGEPFGGPFGPDPYYTYGSNHLY